MSEATIDIKAGGAEFRATGNQDWVGKQLDKFLENAAKIAAVAPLPTDTDGSTGGGGNSGASGNGSSQNTNAGVARKPLATYLKEQNATTNQVKKFHATAIWLHAKGAARLNTTDVSKALKASNQTKINNPSDCLNQNVKKGLCEKDGNQFFVTDDGSASYPT
ncbi:MAG: hypothetical protein M3032_06615 [Verrucomicrobiota bacterium]|nr:hypothetical protein [Verrucomicrobiota bacterium]